MSTDQSSPEAVGVRSTSAFPRTAVAAAVAVVVAAAGIGGVVSRHRGSTGSSAARALEGVVGYRWQVASISDGQGKTAVATSWDALVSFSRDGVVGANDTVNDLSAHYRTVSTGYALTGDRATTQVGYSGADPVRSRTVTAVDTLFGLRDGRQSSAVTAVRVVVELRGGVLTLRRQGVTVTATRAGAQPDVNASPGPAADTNQFTYLGPVRRTTVAAGISLLLKPPGAAAARVSPSQAFRNLCTNADASASCADSTLKPDMVLARLTTPNSGHVRADGTIKPSLENVLSYVVTWHGIPCPDYGGPAGTGGRPTPTFPQACTETDVVSATTGRPIAGQYYG